MNNIAPVLALSIAATCCLPASAQQLDVARFLKERGAESAELRQLARSPSPAVVPVATSYISMFRSDAGKQLVAIASIANDGALKVEETCPPTSIAQAQPAISGRPGPRCRNAWAPSAIHQPDNDTVLTWISQR